jgi:tRNA pseudouridine55 synthase
LTLEVADASSIRFSVDCSKGTYLRSLARDLGTALGSAAHLEQLRRVRSGRFSIADASPLDCTLDVLADEHAVPMIGMREALAEIPEVAVDQAIERRLHNGDWHTLSGIVPAGATLFKVLSGSRLVAIARADSAVSARLVKVFGGRLQD